MWSVLIRRDAMIHEGSKYPVRRLIYSNIITTTDRRNVIVLPENIASRRSWIPLTEIIP
jgi:hypothetical protein